MKIAIAGAGLSGRLLAFILSHQHEVSVFDPATDSQQHLAAGWTAAGMLSPLAELESSNLDVYRLGQRSIQLWSQLQAFLLQQNQQQLDDSNNLELKLNGSLMVAHRGDEGAADRLISLLSHKAPKDDLPTPITIEQLKQLEADIHGPAHAWLLQKEGQINTVRAMSVLQRQASNVHWHWGQTVTQLKPHRIRLDDNSEHEFDWVFDCRGVGARRFKSANPHSLSCQNVRGVRGEVLWLQTSEVKLQRPIRLLHPRYRVYIVHRAPDLLVVGASELESEDRSPISVRTCVELLTAAHSVLPGIAEARIIHTETNLRPALVDNLPRIENETGLTRINGLFRHGWLISPALIEQALQAIWPDQALLPL
ncbi:FAD-dependent oxidoreductase [Brackiella oedipodis]|uniref:FAD-dependent oxidoreductase n=1 Tax=Brackiella oedipodis TaxID=124225 RepID=UPI0004912B42|nr:FAD-dependent oxidoreductase [Brackiella oedipodis]